MGLDSAFSTPAGCGFASACAVSGSTVSGHRAKNHAAAKLTLRRFVNIIDSSREETGGL
jgi:hypothetical protein